MSRGGIGALLAVTFGVLVGCGDPRPTGSNEAPGSALDPALRGRIEALGLTGDPSLGRTIPEADDPLVRLGRLLFFSKTLSGEFDVACASCHHPELGGGDGLSLPVGVAASAPDFLGPGRVLPPENDRDPRRDGGPNVPRNAPTTFNSSLYDRALFHDGRVFSLDADARPGGEGARIRTPDSRFGVEDPRAGRDFLAALSRFPVTSFNEMRGFGRLAVLSNEGVREELAARLRGESVDSSRMTHNDWLFRFREGFGEPDGTAAELLTFDRIAEALAAYQRSQVFVDNPWRRYVQGDTAAIDEAAKRGALLFFTDPAEGGAGCVRCHSGDHFTDETFRRVGFPQIGRGKEVYRDDLGRFMVTNEDADRHAFRVPSLLNIEVTGPYGHDGAFATLDSLLAHHVDPAAGMATYRFSLDGLPQLAGTGVSYPWARPLSMARLPSLDPAATTPGIGPLDRADLAAFLATLTDPCVRDPACLAPFVPGAEEDPDGHLLVRSSVPPSTPAPPPPHNATPTSDGPGLAPSTVGIDTRLLVCGHRIAESAGSASFVEEASARGLGHVHGFSTSRWSSEENPELLLTAAGVSAGDVDGDCHPDLVFATGDTRGTLAYRNVEGAGFALAGAALPLPPGTAASGTMIADLDADRRSEIVVGTLGPGAIHVVGGDLEAGLLLARSISSARSTMGLSAGDLDGDGDPEVAAAHWDYRGPAWLSPMILRNDGAVVLSPADGQFRTGGAFVANDFGFSPALLDFDRDGLVDLLLAADFGHSTVLLQREGALVDTTDRSVVRDSNGMGSVLADFDNDGDLDWFVTSIYAPYVDPTAPIGARGNRLYRNDGGGVLVDVTEAAGVDDGAWGWAACGADFDNDGDIDLLQTNGWSNVPAAAVAPLGHLPSDYATYLVDYLDTPARLFVNQGDGSFVDRAVDWGADTVRQGRGLTCFDADRDGDVDAAVAIHSGAPKLLSNQRGAGAGHRFLSVRLVGLGPNTEALGARITVRTGGRVQTREVLTYSHHLSHDPLDQHFGVASASTIDEVRVRWPDGSPDTVLTNVSPNRFLVLRHPGLSPTATLDAATLDRIRALAQAGRAYVDRGDVDSAVLPYLQGIARWYGLSLAVDPLSLLDVRLTEAVTGSDEATASALRVLRRRMEATSMVTVSDLVLAGGTSGLVARAASCREIPLLPTFASSLAIASLAGGASSVDALEAWALATWNGCGSKLSRPVLAALVDRVASAVDLGDGSLDRTDLRALALLAHLGREDRIPVWQIAVVLDAAQPGGRFGSPQPLDGSDAPPDDLATAYAAWFLETLLHHARAIEPLVP